MIMQVMRVAPMTLSQNDFQVSVRCHQAIAREPSTPQAAHSVAVAQPMISVTKTNRMSSAAGIRFHDALIRSRIVIFIWSGGVFSGCSSDQPAM